MFANPLYMTGDGIIRNTAGSIVGSGLAQGVIQLGFAQHSVTVGFHDDILAFSTNRDHGFIVVCQCRGQGGYAAALQVDC